MSDSKAEWSYTSFDLGRAKSEPFFEEPSAENRNGVYRGRRIIGRDTPINGGVYLGGGAFQEAIVIDDVTQPQLGEVYKKLVSTVEDRKNKGLPYRNRVLNDVYDLACQSLPYDLKKVNEILDEAGKDRKIALGLYLDHKVGVCRHQALLCAYLLEKLKADGYVRGSVSVDRNYVPGKGGHAWVRYTNSVGEVYIIDPAQHYIGALGKVPRDAWFYKRPTDK